MKENGWQNPTTICENPRVCRDLCHTYIVGMRKVFLVALIILGAILLLRGSRRREGYLDQLTELINAQKGNDEYLNTLLRSKGYAGTKDPAENKRDLTESARIIQTYYCADGSLKSDHLFNSCFYDIKSPWTIETHPLLHNPYTTRELADGQKCLNDADCYSNRCVFNYCKSVEQVAPGWSSPGPSSSVYSILSYTGIFVLSILGLVVIIFGGEDGETPRNRSHTKS